MNAVARVVSPCAIALLDDAVLVPLTTSNVTVPRLKLVASTAEKLVSPIIDCPLSYEERKGPVFETPSGVLDVGTEDTELMG